MNGETTLALFLAEYTVDLDQLRAAVRELVDRDRQRQAEATAAASEAEETSEIHRA